MVEKANVIKIAAAPLSNTLAVGIVMVISKLLGYRSEVIDRRSLSRVV
jgi:hypothetical protein